MTRFKVLHKDGKARVGKLETPHGVIDTPNFIPVGTQASVKALSVRDLKGIGAQIILANTYHLMLRPGDKIVKKMGGLHKFMSWDRPIMTDSGGYQVFSLGVGLEHPTGKVFRAQPSTIRPRLNKVTEEGVVFKSHLDGSQHLLSPESSIKIQANLGADLIVAFDDHESAQFNYDQTLSSLELTGRWGLRSLEELKRLGSKQLMYGVVHGGKFEDLRIRSAHFTDKHFDAIAIGGIYEDRKTMNKIIGWTVANVSDEKVRHMLGVSEIENLFDAVERGMDLFDCVAPTRRARHGFLYTQESKGKLGINIRLSEYKTDKKPIDSKCHCYTCQNYSRAYLRHLYIAEELLYHNLSTYHDVYFIINLMKMIREAILEGKFKDLKSRFIVHG